MFEIMGKKIITILSKKIAYTESNRHTVQPAALIHVYQVTNNDGRYGIVCSMKGRL